MVIGRALLAINVAETTSLNSLDQVSGLDWVQTRTGGAVDLDQYQYVYDNDGRVKVRMDAGGDSGSDPLAVENFGYSSLGDLTTFAIAGGASVQYTLDSMGNRLGSTTYDASNEAANANASGGNTTMLPFGLGAGSAVKYDAWGRAVSISTTIDNDSDSRISQTVGYSYDALGRLVQTTTTVVDNSVSTTSTDTIIYDAADHPVQENSTSPSAELQYVWSAADSRLILRDTVGSKRVYALIDAQGDVTSLVDYVQLSGQTSATWQVAERYTYNADGIATAYDVNWNPITSSSTTETQYGYTAHGQLESVTVARQDGAAPSQSFSGNRFSSTGTAISTTLPTTLYSYDADGNVTKIAYANGTETDYDYSQLWNASGGIETVANKNSAGGVLSSFVYTFNNQREKVQSQEYMLNSDGTSTNTTISWQYDADGKLTDETLVETNASGGTVAADSYHDHYVYDLAGNRTNEWIDASDTGNYTSENFYTYNYDGQLTGETDNVSPTPWTPNPAIQYVYDHNGSLIETDSVTYNNSGGATYTPQTTYGYNERGQMVNLSQGSLTTHYAYNTNGDRIAEYNTSSSSVYVVDDNNPTGYSQVLETWTGGSTPAVTYEIGATIISQTVSGTGSGAGTQYIMPDGHGSTRQLTAYTASSGTNGTVVAREDYDAFGNSITIGMSANIASTVILYTGQMWDAGSQTYHDRARKYDPRLGRFESFDNFNIAPADIGNLNKYLYAGANPVNNWDPTGHYYTPEDGAEAEEQIDEIYAEDHPATDDILYGAITRLGLPGSPSFKLKPDIFNNTSHKWLEIKPLTYSGVAKAALQFTAYTFAYLPFGYSPEVGWKPSTHNIEIDGAPAFFFNAAGIVFYTDSIDLAAQLLTLTTLAAVRSFLASEAGAGIAKSLVQILGDSIPGLVTEGVAGESIGFTTSIAAEGLLGAI